MYNPFLETLDFGGNTGMGRPSPSFDMGPGPGDLPPAGDQNGLQNPMPLPPMWRGGALVDRSQFSKPTITPFANRPQGLGEPEPDADERGGPRDSDADDAGRFNPMPLAPQGWKGGLGAGLPTPPGTGGFNFQTPMGAPGGNGGFMPPPPTPGGEGIRSRGFAQNPALPLRGPRGGYTPPPPMIGGAGAAGLPPQLQQLMSHPLFGRMLQSLQARNPQNGPSPRRDAGPGLGAGQPGIDWVRR